MIHSKHFAQFDLNFCYHNEWYHFGCIKSIKVFTAQKHTQKTGIYTMVEWHTNRNVFRSILDCGQIRMIRSQTVKMPATAYLNVLMLSTVTDDDWLKKTARAKKNP